MKQVHIKNINDINIIQNDIFDKYQDHIKDEISKKTWNFLIDILKKDYDINVLKEDIFFNQYGKPYLKNNYIYFNISHSKNMIALIISDNECGIDIEYIDKTRNIEGLSKKVLSSKEKEEFDKNKDIEIFYKFWTQKEAYYKYKGFGIEYKNLRKEINKDNIITKKIKESGDEYFVSYIEEEKE